MASGSFDEPPSYAGSNYSRSTVASPSYSPSPRLSEFVVRSSSDATCTSLQDYVYHSKHITVNLGSKEWGTRIPVYGNGAFIEGKLSLSGDIKSMTSVCIKLEGTVTNTYSERGLVTGSSSVDVLSTSASFATPVSGDWTEDQPFSFPLPAVSTGRKTPLPPSSIMYHLGVTCAVKYRLKVTVNRKGFRRHESLKIPLLYLPRSFAEGPLLLCIPDIFADRSRLTQRSPEDIKEVHIVPLRPSGKNRSLANAPSIILALPSILSFASYDIIPLTLSIFSTQTAAIAKLLLSSAKIHLIKRTRTWLHAGRSSSKNESIVGIAEIVDTDEGHDGMSVVSYELRASRPAGQKSWAVEGVADQKYYICATVCPPSSTASHLPNYECEQLIELTTDAYDSPEREMVALGGAPSPAIGTLGLVSPDSRLDGAQLAIRSLR